MKRIKYFTVCALLLSVMCSAFALAGCSSDNTKESEVTTTSTIVTETETEPSEEPETTESKQIWTPSDAGIYDSDSLTSNIESILLDVETLSNPTLISFAEKFQSEGLDLVELNKNVNMPKTPKTILVYEGYKVSNYYSKYTNSTESDEGTNTIISGLAIALTNPDDALDFFNENVDMFIELYPDAEREKTETGMSFRYSDDETNVWVEYNYADDTVIVYEEYSIF